MIQFHHKMHTEWEVIKLSEETWIMMSSVIMTEKKQKKRKTKFSGKKWI